MKALAHRWPASGKARFAIATVALLGLGIATILCHHNPRAHEEHGWLENIQAVAISLAAITLAAGAVTLPRPRRVFALGIALFCFVFLMLEFDTRAFKIPALTRATNGTVRNAWLGGLVVLYSISFWRTRRHMPALLFRWLGSRAGLLMILSGAFWIAGAVFEHGKFFADPESTLILEEVIEVNAAIFMAWSAAATIAFLRTSED